MLSLILALTLSFKTPFFFSTFIWVLIEKPQDVLVRLQEVRLHVSANLRRSILTKILENTPEEVEKKPLEEESQIVEPESLPDPSPPLAVPDPKPLEKEPLEEES